MSWLSVQGRKLLLAAVSVQHLEERGVLSGAVLGMKHLFCVWAAVLLKQAR